LTSPQTLRLVDERRSFFVGARHPSPTSTSSRGQIDFSSNIADSLLLSSPPPTLRRTSVSSSRDNFQFNLSPSTDDVGVATSCYLPDDAGTPAVHRHRRRFLHCVIDVAVGVLSSPVLCALVQSTRRETCCRRTPSLQRVLLMSSCYRSRLFSHVALSADLRRTLCVSALLHTRREIHQRTSVSATKLCRQPYIDRKRFVNRWFDDDAQSDWLLPLAVAAHAARHATSNERVYRRLRHHCV